MMNMRQKFDAELMKQAGRDPKRKRLIPDKTAKPIRDAKEVTIPTMSETAAYACARAGIICLHTFLDVN